MDVLMQELQRVTTELESAKALRERKQLDLKALQAEISTLRSQKGAYTAAAKRLKLEVSDGIGCEESDGAEE